MPQWWWLAIRSYGEIRCSFETFESDICLQFNVNFSEIIQYHNQSNSSYQAKAIALAKNQYSRSFSWLIKDYALDPKPKLENGSKYIINIDSSSWTHNIPDLQLNCSVIIKSLDLIRANMNWNLLDTTPEDLISCGQKILSCSCEVRLGHLSISQVKAYALYSKSHFSGPSKPTYWDGTGDKSKDEVIFIKSNMPVVMLLNDLYYLNLFITRTCKVIHNISCHGFEDYYRCNYTQNDTSYYEPISNNTIVLQKDMNDELKVVKILERDRYIGIRSRSDMLRKQTYFINCPIMGIQYQTPDFIKAGGSPINLLPAFVKITNELPNTTSIVPSVPTSSREISQNATGQSITTILKSQAQNCKYIIYKIPRLHVHSLLLFAF
ncbi:hypothetical protein TrispH2_007157 [Trichoplax sp. H2]|nr:hypothetical protein TrispH2_007157 [Trichoplax sp. H2]|eukprot:RDD41745.1 hypothetical protein TrispH2_007157 [Trichoplax sp. H2]